MSKNFPIFGDKMEAELYKPDQLIDLFLNCTADGFAIVDMENRIIRVNHMYTKIFGYTEEDVIGKRIDELSYLITVVEIISQVKKGKAFTDVITQRVHKNGSILDIAASYSPFRNSSGEIIAVIAIFRDITKFINMERELKKTRELYKLITENTTDMIKVFSKDKKIIYASPSYEKVVGIPPEEFVGRDLHEFFFPEEIEPYKKALQKIVDTGEPQLFQKK
ncbi:PAS domain-containing protein [Neobacillus pocheonensis]|uniref:PAS domain-containing protein n=1 Tax=Neobacillus pocheonensis TaxID=363869 RepID=A0ABT0WIP4_9BACI|nr:PAS domain-containing protein [Neobacillus pocheonensis]